MDNPVEVYNAANEVDANIVVAMLGKSGIRAQVVGGILGSALGELPAGAVSPRVWINDSDMAAARPLMEAWQAETVSARLNHQQPGWTCPRCDSEVEFGFDVCWNCLYNPSAC